MEGLNGHRTDCSEMGMDLSGGCCALPCCGHACKGVMCSCVCAGVACGRQPVCDQSKIHEVSRLVLLRERYWTEKKVCGPTHTLQRQDVMAVSLTNFGMEVVTLQGMCGGGLETATPCLNERRWQTSNQATSETLLQA